MIRREYLARLVDASPIQLYASGVDGARCWWPWRMLKASAEADTRHGRQARRYLIDSNFSDDSVGNKEVLDTAADQFADAAVLADVYQDIDGTVDRLRDGLRLASDHRFSGTIILPLQPPVVECYERVVPYVTDEMDVWWAIGGLKDEPASRKVNAARSLRKAVGPDGHIHGLGFGATDRVARAVRSDPGLLDSVDNSGAVSNSIGGLPGTSEKMTITAAEATRRRLEALRKFTPFAEDDPADLRPDGQTSLGSVLTDGGDR